MVEGGKKMSRLSEMLCVKEGQEFRHGAKQRTYKVVGENFYQKKTVKVDGKNTAINLLI